MIKTTNKSKTFLACWFLPSVIFLLVQSVHATLLFYDGFNYTVGQRLGDSSSSTVWENAKDPMTIAAGSLTYSGLQTSTGNQVNVASTTASLDGVRTLTGAWASQTNGTLYVSFLLKVQSTTGIATTGDGTSLVTVSKTSNNTQLLGINLLNSSGIKLGVLKYPSTSTQVSSAFFSSGTGANLSANGSTVYLIVAKYEWIAGTGNDVVTVWVNPSNLGETEDSGNKVSTSTGTDGTQSAGRFTISRGANFSIDELRIGQTWAEVTPSDGSQNQSSSPVIAQAIFSPGGMILRGINGSPSGVYQILASTNIALPLSNWPAITTNSFDANGNFDSTNPVIASANQQYFRLLVGGSLPPPPTAPGITNQPQSLTVAVGANAMFSVGATGTAPFNYFWSFNTNTPVGGNSSTLSLNNVQLADSGSYRVVITNSAGSATSSVATLTVLLPPVITENPTNLTLGTGDTAIFNVTATGSQLQYQWYDDAGSIDGETNATLTLPSITTADAGNYFVTVTNDVGIAISSNATLTVLGPPVIVAQPQSHTATVSNDTVFTVDAAGPALTYQWFFNTNIPVGINSNRLDLLNVQTTDAGTYNVIVTNNYGAITSSFAMLTVNTSILANVEFDLVGFAQNTTGGGEIPDTDPAYVKVTNALQLANAVLSFNKTGGVKVIEIMNDLDLGWNEIGTNVQNLGSTPFNAAATPKLHPRLIQTGVSKMDIKYKNGGLTIFSANGATIRHCTFNIKSTHNIIIRNLKFDEMWEWDESSKGNYDGNDWDFIDLANGGPVYDIWIDHCTFTKAYDGIVDMKAGSTNVTLSWCRYLGDDSATNRNSFVWQQINSLESNKTSYTMYNFLRNNGFSTTNIVQIIQGHDKTHLMGSNDKDSNNINLSCTFHHLWFQNCWDRVVPRLRAGNVHDFNIYVDDATALVAKRLRDTVQLSMSSSASNSLKNTYSFNPFLNGTISTENGAILVEKSIYNDCLSPLRNNQTDPSDPTYTGKIMALDCIYHFDNADSTTIDFRGDSTNAPGSTYFGPAQAPIIPFSWNGFTTLPYSYTNVLTDPAQLPAVLANGAGAGVLTWDKTNWLKTSY